MHKCKMHNYKNVEQVKTTGSGRRNTRHIPVMSFQGQVFPANHLAMVLVKQNYNTKDKQKLKDKHKKPQN